MRLINADALLKELNDNNIEYNACVNHFILNAPTIDSEPVVHAHWIKSNFDNVDGTIYTCSNCNTEVFSVWNYCPNCGAKMG